jgi:hypothetical protein
MRASHSKTKSTSDYDGYVASQLSTSGNTWEAAVTASAGALVNDNQTTVQIIENSAGGNWRCGRAYFHFDFSNFSPTERLRLKLLSAQLTLNIENRDVSDSSSDIVKLFKSDVSRASGLGTADFDQFSTTILSDSEKQISGTGAVSIPIDGPLLNHLEEELGNMGSFSVFLRGKLDYDYGNQDDPTTTNRFQISSDNNSTAGNKPKLEIIYEIRRYRRVRRGGSKIGGRDNIQSVGLSGFSGEK